MYADVSFSCFIPKKAAQLLPLEIVLEGDELKIRGLWRCTKLKWLLFSYYCWRVIKDIQGKKMKKRNICGRKSNL